MFMVLVHGSENAFPFRTYVAVRNDLGGGIALFTHCQSRDDDLGRRMLANGESQNWSFIVNFQGSTLFWCRFKWNEVIKTVDIYNAQTMPASECVLRCHRSIRQDGIYFFSEKTESWYKKYSWD